MYSRTRCRVQASQWERSQLGAEVFSGPLFVSVSGGRGWVRRLRRTASPSRAPRAHRVSHSDGSSRQAPHGPNHIAAPVRGRRQALAPRDLRRGGSASRPRTTAAELLSPDAPAPRLSRSWPTSFNSLRLEQLRQPLARVEHARLDRGLRNANGLCYLF